MCETIWNLNKNALMHEQGTLSTFHCGLSTVTADKVTRKVNSEEHNELKWQQQ